MKKLTSIILLCTITAILFLSSCGPKESSAPGSNLDSYQFTDALGREVTVTSHERVGITSGSFAECWLLAGGTLAAVTKDAIEERQLDLPADIINLGSIARPSAEAILAADLDLLILPSTIKNQLTLAETLEKTNITYAYMNVETFNDYLVMLKIFTDITGRSDLYEQNGTSITHKIETILSENLQTDAPKVLILRTSSTKVVARDSQTTVGQMLKDFGCNNIADSERSLLEELSLEVIAAKDPDYIFIICQGDVAEAQANLTSTINANPIWNRLTAVQNDNVHYLEKELFHYKPNARWSESYEVLADIFAEN